MTGRDGPLEARFFMKGMLRSSDAILSVVFVEIGGYL